MNKKTDTEIKVLTALKNAKDYISGASLAKELNVTRTAVWKAVKKLKTEGYDIYSKTNLGYKLIKADTNLSSTKIKNLLENKNINVVVLDEVDSTNDYAKKFLNEDFSVIIAKHQTKGRGRLNRTFYSPNNVGLYMSLVVKPKAEIIDSVNITTFCGVVVQRAIEKLTGLDAKIKWVNDIFVNGKKVSGILTEASCDFELNKLNYAIVGIGVNLYDIKFPFEINDIATNLQKESGIKVDINEFTASIVNAFSELDYQLKNKEYMNIYREKSLVLGKTVKIVGAETFEGKAVEITDLGALKVLVNGEIKTVNAGDCSLKL